jgi:predicted small metal-binding protein
MDYSMLGLNLDGITNRGQDFNLKQLIQVRSNFDEYFAGKYEKTLEAKAKSYVEGKADELYMKETGGKEVDRASALWKSLRNVELLKYDRNVWETVQSVPPQQQQGAMRSVVEQPRDAKDNVLTSPVGSAPKKPSHTGHGTPEKVETGTKPFGEGVQPKTPDNTAHDKNEKAAVTNVFEWSTDYRKNYEKAYGAIPAGHQIHHVTPRAVFRDNDLAREWVRRGITKLDYPENLQALPQTKDAYDKSNIKIQHSGSHDRWSDHAEEVLRGIQEDLEEQYGSLDKVPDDVMERIKGTVMKDLREDLLDKDLGLEKGWIIPKDTGMDKLSRAQQTDQIG